MTSLKSRAEKKKKEPQVEITEAFVKHLNKQMNKSINNLVNIAYAEGKNDALESAAHDAMHTAAIWGCNAATVQAIGEHIRALKSGGAR